MDDAIRALAKEAGIASDWTDAAGQPQRVSVETLRSVLAALGFACGTAADIAQSRNRLQTSRDDKRDFFTTTTGAPTPLNVTADGTNIAAEFALEDGKALPLTLQAKGGAHIIPAIDQPGYHRLRFANREITLAVTPPRCVTCGDIAPGDKMYGLAVQLYSLRQGHDGGIGDTAALRDFATAAAREGADALALSPTHSLFAADPSHYGPYSPSSRLFLNPIFADPTATFEANRIPAAEEPDTPPKQADLIDWPSAAKRKYALLRRLFEDFAATDLPQQTSLAHDFASFVRDGGDRLHEHALFEAVHAHWRGVPEPKMNWSEWPEEWRKSGSPVTAQFAREHSHEVQFHAFLQWLASRSFAAVQDGARRAGMRIGLISDLAVGMSPSGSHAWSRQDDLLLGLSIGAPPDLFNTRGQDWGLTGFSPQALLTHGFEPFLATLRAAMRHAGGVRIDHAMGLTRLWVVPHGCPSSEGAYLAYPIDDMLRLIALESHRHHAIVIGEDLGTVPLDFRDRLAACGIAGMDVLWFQRDEDGFMPPRSWRADAVAMTATHDLPTVAGWWKGADIATRDALGLADQTKETSEREADRALLWSAFRKAKATKKKQPKPDETESAVDAAIAFTAQSPASLALIPIEDVMGVAEQPNLPGTINEHPNWRRRFSAPASEMLDAPPARARLKTLRERA